MSKGRTVYEIMRDWWKTKREKPLEQTIFNPLSAKIGSHVRLINHAEFGDSLWSVVAIRAWQRTINGMPVPLVDYLLDANDAGTSPQLTLRLAFQETTKAWLLTQFWPEGTPGPQGWSDESLHVLDALCDVTGELLQHAGTEREVKFWRDGIHSHCTMTHLQDRNGDGTVTPDETTTEPMTLWCYRRATTDPAGQTFEQHLHAQLSGLYHPDTKTVAGGDKTILLLAGELIPVTQIMLY